MDNNFNLKDLFKMISDSTLLNFSKYIEEDKLSTVREFFNFDIDSYLENMSMLLYDVKNGYYKNIDNKTIWSISLLFIYIKRYRYDFSLIYFRFRFPADHKKLLRYSFMKYPMRYPKKI